MVMFDLIKMLAEGDVEFVLVGGLAVALHGYPRLTMDVDVVLAMDDKNLRRFIDGARAAARQNDTPFRCQWDPIPEKSSQHFTQYTCALATFQSRLEPAHCPVARRKHT